MLCWKKKGSYSKKAIKNSNTNSNSSNNSNSNVELTSYTKTYKTTSNTLKSIRKKNPIQLLFDLKAT